MKTKKQDVRTYGRIYCISTRAVRENREEVLNRLYRDICECLIKNNVLSINSEGNPFETTFGWKLKGVKLEDD